MATSGHANDTFRFRPDLMVEPIESPKKFNMKKVTILDDEEANKSRKSRLKQQRKEDRDDHHDDSEDSGTGLLFSGHVEYVHKRSKVVRTQSWTTLGLSPVAFDTETVRSRPSTTLDRFCTYGVLNRVLSKITVWQFKFPIEFSSSSLNR